MIVYTHKEAEQRPFYYVCKWRCSAVRGLLLHSVRKRDSSLALSLIVRKVTLCGYCKNSYSIISTKA